MTETAGDRWATGDAYELYMGRWSRALSRAFLEWLKPGPKRHWLEIGCGTGALTSSIVALTEPASVVGCDPSASFVEDARHRLTDERVAFVVGGADAPPRREGGFDVLVSGLVLNFVPELPRALVAMRERLRPGGTLAAYVWDYAGGIEFLAHFWREAVAANAGAADLDEARRFPDWQPARLGALFRDAGFDRVETDVVEIPTHFTSFDDFWKPFLGRTGPAPAYVAALEPGARDTLRKRLEAALVPAADGSIRLRARASVARGVVAQ